MKNILCLFFIGLILLSGSANAGSGKNDQKQSKAARADSIELEILKFPSNEYPNDIVIPFSAAAEEYVQGKKKNILIDFSVTDFPQDIIDSAIIVVNDHRQKQDIFNVFRIKNISPGDYSIGVYRFSDGDTLHFHGNTLNHIQIKVVEKAPDEPLITNDAVVLGLLLLLLLIIFKTLNMKAFERFYKIVPALLLCYFLPALLNTFGIVSSEMSNLYFIASRYMLPASLVLLCLSIDLKSIMQLGPKALIMFFAATLGIVIGGPLALYVVSLFDSSVLMGQDDPAAIWRGLSTVAGSWIGGGANQTAMKEIYEAPDTLFSAMIIVDVFVANLFMAVLLFGTGHKERINRFFKADDSAIKRLEQKMDDFQKKVSTIPTFSNLMIMFGVVFSLLGLAHFLSDLIAPEIEEYILAKLEANPESVVRYFTSFGSGFFWLIVLSTIFGITLSFTKARKFEGIGASKFGSIFLYFLVATIGMKMNIMELIENWGIFKLLISIGLIWMFTHVVFLFITAKIIKAPFFFLAVGSQANVGGAASAPVVASAFNPSLAPVGVLLAVLGYAVGTFGAILCTIFMIYVSG